jgi:rhodanese-related sulfurtransferase
MTDNPYKTILPEELEQRLLSGEQVNVVDVRELEEWQWGHIPGIKLIPLSEFVERVGEIDPEQETILVCRSGSRSGRACEYLLQFGYNVVNMVGGMNAWKGDIAQGD